MGCIVNGPGEMADADYGYVGAGRGKISLYKKKECIEKNIPEEEAVEKLIELIRKNGDYTERRFLILHHKKSAEPHRVFFCSGCG